MKIKINIPASTLSEILVVMILTGIILLSVFDGFSLFQKLLLRMEGRLEQSIEQVDGFYRLESLFSGSDSICGDASRLMLYRQGNVRNEIVMIDSLLIIVRPETEIKPDTLLRRIAETKIVRNPDNPNRIDSLLLVHDTVSLRLGIRSRIENLAELDMKEVERLYENHEAR